RFLVGVEVGAVEGAGTAMDGEGEVSGGHDGRKRQQVQGEQGNAEQVHSSTGRVWENRMIARVPSPGRLCRLTGQPNLPLSRRTMARPIPWPSPPARPRKNGSNARSSSSASMPLPVS